MSASELRKLPAVQTIKSLPDITALADRIGEEYVTSLVRAEIERSRQTLRNGGDATAPTARQIADAVVERAKAGAAPAIQPVINATGVIIHTNLGRAPLAPEAAAAVHQAAVHPGALELDLASGRRGDRDRLVADLLCELTGAEGATVVNNNAAAVLLALDTLARDRDVVISRGELVEIGGSFRIPDVLARSGARLVEVGTTNKTRVGDYEQVITPDTAVLMKVHQSNFRVVGFAEETTREELAALGARTRVTVVEDLGSGALLDLRAAGIQGEPLVQASIAAGIDVVTFSGDKLLGGPQAGIIVGKREPVDAMRRNPLMRALRPDKMTYAALAATLRLYRTPDLARQRIPVLAAIHRPLEEIRDQAQAVAQGVGGADGLDVSLEPSESTIGGGAAPGLALPSIAVVVRHRTLSVDELARRLRAGAPAVVGKIADDALWLDQRTVPPEQVEDLIAHLTRALAS